MSVSVVIPAWNAELYLAEALDSVLAQSCPVDEIVVVDDGSTDATAAVCERYPRVRYERQANAGAGAARNRGVALTSGEYVAFLDADDLWTPEKVALQVSALHDREVEAVFASARNFISPERTGELAPPRTAPPSMPAYIPSALMTRRSVLEQQGPFSTGGSLTDWVEWYLRFLDGGGRVFVCPELLVHRRIHGANASMRDPAGMKAYVRMLKTSIDRRRLTGGDS